MTNLQVHKHVPIVCKVVFCLEESTVIILMCLRVIILIIIATSAIFRICLLILYISKVAEVTATELLQIQSTRYVPVLVLVIAGVNNSVGVL